MLISLDKDSAGDPASAQIKVVLDVVCGRVLFLGDFAY